MNNEPTQEQSELQKKIREMNEGLAMVKRSAEEERVRKQRENLPSTVTSEDDPRHDDRDGVTVQSEKVRGWKVTHKRTGVQKPGPGTLSVAETHSRGGKKPEDVE